MTAYISEIISFLLGGIAGSLLTVAINKKTAKSSGVLTDQSNSRAGGDIVGRDKRS